VTPLRNVAAPTRALGRLARFYALSVALMLCVIGGLTVHQIALGERITRASVEKSHVDTQLSLLADLMKLAADAVTSLDSAARHSAETRLGAALGAMRATRRCGKTAAMDPALRALYRGDGDSLCARADRFFAAADGIASGPAGAREAFAEMLALAKPLRMDLETVHDHYMRMTETLRQRRRGALRLGVGAVGAMLLGQALFVFRPGWRAAREADVARETALAEAWNATEHLRAAHAELRASQAEAIAARDAAESADRLKTEFLARVSHEIRTPLNGVLGSAAMLAGDANPVQKPHLAVIDRSAHALLAMVEDMIDLARLSTGDFTIEPAPFELDALLAPLLADLEAVARDRGLRVSVDLGPEAQGRYVGDPARLRRALRAVLDNALKFGRGAVALSVRRWGDGGLLVAVEDDGPGVDPEQRERVFAHFAQADGSATRPKGGLGQGLALSRAILRAMGGEIGVGDAALGGARFYIRIPLLRLGAAEGARRVS